MTTLTTHVTPDDATAKVSAIFDLPFDGSTTFETWPKPDVDAHDYGEGGYVCRYCGITGLTTLPCPWQVGYIVGPTGTGKSLLLAEFGDVDAHKDIRWDETKAIVSQFGDVSDAIDRLTGCGLNTAPSWLRPFHVLSTGERFRAKLARQLRNGAVIDEFTSNVDRHVAMAVSRATRRFIDQRGLQRVVFASPHYDVVPWLEPDWTFDTRTGILHRGRLRRPSISVRVYPSTRGIWPLFAPHHYLSAKLHKAAKCLVAFWDAPIYDDDRDTGRTRQVVVGCSIYLHAPSQKYGLVYREHRTVILPDYQGLGIGPRLSDMTAGYVTHVLGKHYYSRTGHPRMMRFRDGNPNWRLVSKTKFAARDVSKKITPWWGYLPGLRATHEYQGPEVGEVCDA